MWINLETLTGAVILGVALIPLVAYPQMAVLTFLGDAVAWVWRLLLRRPRAPFTREAWLSVPGGLLVAVLLLWVLGLGLGLPLGT